jgi:hypothetical protein
VSVCALVGRPSRQLEDGLSDQGADLAEIVADGQLRRGLERALESDPDWVWVLDGSSIPRPGALAALLGGLDRVGELAAPVLLAGVVVTPDGRVDPNRPPWYRRFHLELAMTSVDRGLLPVRASAGPVLVRRQAIEAQPPRAAAAVAPGAVLEWTAALLRDATGYLVADSESVAAEASRDPMRDPATALRLLLGRTLAWRDRLGLLLELTERAGPGSHSSRG